MIKLRISDDDLEQALDRYQSGSVSARTVRGTIESAGIEAPAVTVEELANAVIHASWGAPTAYAERVARAVLDLMQRRTVPAATGSQWVDLARVTDEELGSRTPHGADCVNSSCDTLLSYGEDLRAWLIEKCGGAR